MATNPSALAENIGRITAPDGGYPFGSAKDDTTGTTGDGTPIKKALLNDTYGFQQALLDAASIAPSGTADRVGASQYYDAVLIVAVAAAVNAPRSAVVLSTNTAQALDTITHIHNIGDTTTYHKPDGVGAGETIVNVAGDQLTTSAGAYTMEPVLSITRGYTDAVAVNFKKSITGAPAFESTVSTVSAACDISVNIGGIVYTYLQNDAVTLPALVTGTDYAIYATADGLVASDNFTTPAGYTVSNSRKIGGFHYAPGGNATAQAGGDSTPQINQYSLYDLNYRPATNDPRGLTCVAGSFWAAIYFLNTAPDANGASSYGKTIADGSSPPTIPAALGGNGATTYGSLTWFEAASIATAMGMRMFTQPEFMTAAYGVTEETARGTDPVTTGLDAARTSRWGLMQATGNLWTWAQDRGGPFAAAAYDPNTEGFGSEYNAPNASRLGANWTYGVVAGSRSSDWSNFASNSSGSVGLRFVCDHLQLD